MPLTPAKVRQRPTLVCIGKVGEYGALAEPKEGKLYHFVPIEIVPLFSGLGATFRLLFWPEILTYDSERDAPDMRLKKGQNAENDKKSSRYFVYSNNIAHEDGTAHLQVLLGEKFEAFAAEVAAAAEGDVIPPETFRAILMKFLPVGTQIGYVLKQQKSKTEDGDTKLEDRYEVAYFWPMTDDGVKTIQARVKRAAKGKSPMEMTFQLG